MSHHGEHVFDVPKVNLETEEDLDKQFLEQLKKNHSDHTKHMFSKFVLMYNEIKSMGIDPVQLWRVWSK